MLRRRAAAGGRCGRLAWWCLLTVVLGALQPAAAATGGGSSNEAQALMQLRAGFSNGGTVLSDWGSAGGPCPDNGNSWSGVVCQANGGGPVIAL